MFPKVTYNIKEFLKLNEEIEEIEITSCFSKDAMYGNKVIWLREPSIKWFIHEFFHHVGFSLGLPLWFHRLIHKIF